MRTLWLAPLFFLLTSPLHPNSEDPNAAVRTALQAELGDFSAGVVVNPMGPALLDYQSRVRKIAGPESVLSLHAGSLALVRAGFATERLGVTVYEPEGDPKGTLLFVHGYMSHAANFAYAFDYFFRLGWTVVTLDLPGHGLSTGARADVDSFAEYGDAVQMWLEWVGRQPFKGPRVLLAHSLGSAACFEALRRPNTPRPDKVVFCAPLLAPDWFPALAVGEAALGWWLKRMPSTFGWDGYLDAYTMPVHWIQALSRWLEQLKAQPPLALPLSIYSGDNDTVVDEGWNRQEYRRLVPQAVYTVFPGKGHLFLTEAADRKEALDRLVKDLGLTPLPPRASSP